MTEFETSKVTIMQIEELEEIIVYSVEVPQSVWYSDDGASVNKTLW